MILDSKILSFFTLVVLYSIICNAQFTRFEAIIHTNPENLDQVFIYAKKNGIVKLNEYVPMQLVNKDCKGEKCMYSADFAGFTLKFNKNVYIVSKNDVEAGPFNYDTLNSLECGDLSVRDCDFEAGFKVQHRNIKNKKTFANKAADRALPGPPKKPHKTKFKDRSTKGAKGAKITRKSKIATHKTTGINLSTVISNHRSEILTLTKSVSKKSMLRNHSNSKSKRIRTITRTKTLKLSISASN
ncbi:hypothetical protein AX774_g3093 [Zancudomyces culisetae]|uniref:Uncharacterized protein n=1 Tax=Zancudomyces culisetae TaxID=1213189 RepID=A0A1R1PQZ8_ZANCU|nr:hypothetical protein AX774_g3093 [Zancudomyces culisetae]|eukprot:OMH83406.1 hypothetical protein AX774_g3093 [Zancudomyces culisetae]